ncbi:TIGR04282 family arsenosugar biosynthesis glycosyltransferase [Pseudonocardia nigra]|uniref:TIGR04282 family arsenosugar biosynthesis glycosyltransferase n=1 Tax=Pseudonocardia nigra TaxID=1921578 RepID=UPI001C5E1A5B|nr:TIGR04282 family arsenosugar biosynthesis glycosyltransferase [Pseudonocardia nigra]
MAKAPVPGRAKTRLEPLLGPAGCARLQAELIRHTAATAERAAPGAVFVACAGPAELVAPLVGAATLFPQCEGDLGERMAAAVAHVHALRAAPVVLVGTDCPVLGEEHLAAAAEGLAGGVDVVFGPARDGGYYLVALATPRPAAFAIPPSCWGGPDMLARSLDAAAAAGLTVALIGPEHDLDTPADAAALAADPRVPRAVTGLLT